VFGVGNRMVLTSVNVVTQAIANQTVAKKEDRAMAACMYGFMRSLGMPISVAVRYKPAFLWQSLCALYAPCTSCSLCANRST
jgi:hypothetical protein